MGIAGDAEQHAAAVAYHSTIHPSEHSINTISPAPSWSEKQSGRSVSTVSSCSPGDLRRSMPPLAAMTAALLLLLLLLLLVLSLHVLSRRQRAAALGCCPQLQMHRVLLHAPAPTPLRLASV
jgi:hypothetical protein